MNQRRLLALGLCAYAAAVLLPQQSKAEFLSLLMEQNATNDAFRDTTWRAVVLPADPLMFDVVYGVSRVQSIVRSGQEIPLAGNVWMVLSLTGLTKYRFTDLNGKQYTGLRFGPTNYVDQKGRRYSVPGLLGQEENDVTSQAMVALVELTKPLQETSVLRTLRAGESASRELVDSAINELAQNMRLLAYFGISKENDFWFQIPARPEPPEPAREIFGLSLLEVGPRIDPRVFQPLFATEGQLIDLTQYHFALANFRDVERQFVLGNTEVDIRYFAGPGTPNLVNVVPEPSVAISALSLAVTGVIGFYLRRLWLRRVRV